jgi:hypothetical protein
MPLPLAHLDARVARAQLVRQGQHVLDDLLELLGR